MRWLVITLICFNVYAATDLEDGSVILTPKEAADTRSMFAEIQWKLIEQQNQIQELQKQVEFYKTSRCL